MNRTGPPERPLDEAECARLDQLLSAVRRCHHTSFVVSGVAALVAALGGGATSALTLMGLQLPRVHVFVGTLFVCAVLTALGNRMFNSALPYMKLEPRRPPFAWFPISSPNWSRPGVFLWLMAPVLITALAAGAGTNFAQGLSFLFGGLYLVFVPLTVDRYALLIRTRTDEHGGTARLSIWLLYWLRTLRLLNFLTGIVWLPILALIPAWRPGLERSFVIFIALLVLVEVIRAIGKLLYNRIDRFGIRFGFAPPLGCQTAGNRTTDGG